MGLNKFIQNVKETLGLESAEQNSKKKSIKQLLKKLEEKKTEVKKLLKTKLDKKQKKELDEEYEIILFQIRKGRKVLAKLESKN